MNHYLLWEMSSQHEMEGLRWMPLNQMDNSGEVKADGDHGEISDDNDDEICDIY